MSRGSKGKAKHNGDDHKSGKNGGSPGSRAQQASQQKARGGGNGGGSKPKWKKTVPPGTKRCRHCGGNVTPGNRAKHERRGPDGALFNPCAPAALKDPPPDQKAVADGKVQAPIALVPLPTTSSKPVPAPKPQPTGPVGSWVTAKQWNCKKPSCMATGSYDTEEVCHRGCGCKRPPMDKRPEANDTAFRW